MQMCDQFGTNFHNPVSHMHMYVYTYTLDQHKNHTITYVYIRMHEVRSLGGLYLNFYALKKVHRHRYV